MPKVQATMTIAPDPQPPKPTAKGRELLQELRQVLGGRSNLLDTVIPPLLFALLNGLLNQRVAAWAALCAAVGFFVLRLLRRQPFTYALGGLGSVGVALLLVRVSGRASNYFLPAILGNAASVLLALISLLVRRPLVAWTSHLARRWPRPWYWHPRVRRAYSEVTATWTLYFALRLALQLWLLQADATAGLAVMQTVTSWPATLVLLVASYLYGSWRLKQLQGPSVQEFLENRPPPWQGQKRGF